MGAWRVSDNGVGGGGVTTHGVAHGHDWCYTGPMVARSNDPRLCLYIHTIHASSDYLIWSKDIGTGNMCLIVSSHQERLFYQ